MWKRGLQTNEFGKLWVKARQEFLRQDFWLFNVLVVIVNLHKHMECSSNSFNLEILWKNVVENNGALHRVRLPGIYWEVTLFSFSSFSWRRKPFSWLLQTQRGCWVPNFWGRCLAMLWLPGAQQPNNFGLHTSATRPHLLKFLKSANYRPTMQLKY